MHKLVVITRGYMRKPWNVGRLVHHRNRAAIRIGVAIRSGLGNASIVLLKINSGGLVGGDWNTYIVVIHSDFASG